MQILYLTPAALGEEISVVWRHLRLNIKDDDIDKSLLGAHWSLGGIQPCQHQSSRRSGFAQKTLIVTTIINTLTNIWLVIVYRNCCNLLHVKILFLEILNAPGIHFWKGPLFWSIIFLSVVFPQCGNLQWLKQVIVFSVTWTHCKHLPGLGVDCKGLRIGVSPRETNSGVKKISQRCFF